jgi:hypothetical protein
MRKVVILIISHKPHLTAEETASLQQCFKVLGKYEIVLICPQGMDVSNYRKTAPALRYHFIDPKWLSSYRYFNRLKVSPILYKAYRDYDFILFYELDAWVFRDELNYWCEQNFDLIGAPWFSGFGKASEHSEFLGVGNGGFSLRKVESHLRVLRSLSYVKSPGKLWEEFRSKRSWLTFVKLMAGLTVRNNTFYLFNSWWGNEDVFWGKIASEKFEWFKVPDLTTASKFSMELNAPALYELNGNLLPFGCHKWPIRHADFWSKFIVVDPVATSDKDTFDTHH